MPTAPSRVLRGLSPSPYAFDVLDGDAGPSPEPPTFIAYDDLLALSTPVEAEPPPPAPIDPAEAFEDGRQAGRAERDEEVDALRAEVDRLTAALDEATATAAERATFAERAAERLSTEWTEAIRRTEPQLVSLAIETAEALLDAPLSPEQRTAADRAVAVAVDGVAGEAPLVVALHPVDLLHLQESGLADSLSGAHPGLRWEPDGTFAEGDWSVSTSDAAIRRVRADMVAALRNRLGLTAA